VTSMVVITTMAAYRGSATVTACCGFAVVATG
jgi:hypothetical protein